jgi:hypothetical protein
VLEINPENNTSKDVSSEKKEHMTDDVFCYSSLPDVLKEKYKDGKVNILLDKGVVREENAYFYGAKVFKCSPPTPEEFLDPSNAYLSKSVSDSIFDHIKEDFCNIVNTDSNYLQVCMYGATRQGKSFLARLLIYYTMWYHNCLVSPQKLYGVSPVSSLAIYLIAFNLDKSRQLLMKPLFNLMEQSERVRQVTFADKVKPEQEKLGNDHLVFSKAATVGEVTLASGLQILLGNMSPLSIIGADIVQAYVSEITFFMESAGATEEEIFRLYTDSLDRIKATVGNKYLSFLYLDSSANTTDSIIESYMTKTLKKEKNVFFRAKSRWEARPNLFPKWKETKQTFEVVIGNGEIKPCIVRDKADKKDVPPSLIVNVPIDAKKEFERNLLKSIKDIAGLPTSRENRFITDYSALDNIFSNESLVNIEGILIADSSTRPENLIWDKINPLLFAYNKQLNRHRPLRAPNEPRYIGVDLAFSAEGDVTGISCVHKEYSDEIRDIVYVTDFSFAIGAGENGINLDAVNFCIADIAYRGNMPINGVFVDTFSSENLKQFCERMKISVTKQSVDRTTDPYMYLLSRILLRRLVVGKNIFLKNNLLDLQKVEVKGRSKVDHSYGETNNKYNGDWEKSTAGKNGKDVSDSLAQAVYGASLDDRMPSTSYESENTRLKEILTRPSDKQSMKKSALDILNR